MTTIKHGGGTAAARISTYAQRKWQTWWAEVGGFGSSMADLQAKMMASHCKQQQHKNRTSD
jgi:hypothetical protein